MNEPTIRGIWAAAYAVGMAAGIQQVMMVQIEANATHTPVDQASMAATIARAHADEAVRQFVQRFDAGGEW